MKIVIFLKRRRQTANAALIEVPIKNLINNFLLHFIFDTGLNGERRRKKNTIETEETAKQVQRDPTNRGGDERTNCKIIFNTPCFVAIQEKEVINFIAKMFALCFSIAQLYFMWKQAKMVAQNERETIVCTMRKCC